MVGSGPATASRSAPTARSVSSVASARLINVGGEKLMPAEVETVLLTVPGVRDCRVAGEPTP
jgi:acyl-CoA synthetase (AMP-forming)/AMP-acid ligase II